VRLVLGSDHAGLDLKKVLLDAVRAAGHEVEDLGTFTAASCDYPDIANTVADAVLAGKADRGLLVCGTGQGMAMTVNKRAGLRAAVVSDTFSARMAAAHNDARILCLGQRVVGVGLALEIVAVWLATPFEGGRHAGRVAKIEG
jgi:ribose 5-phosphate isomerase B